MSREAATSRRAASILATAPAVALAALAGAAEAGGWVARDLGVTRREGDCIEAARAAFGDYVTAFGGAAATVRDWTVSAGDLEGRGYDAIVLCAFSDAGRTRGTLAIHAPREDAGRIIAADRLVDLWRLHAKRLDARYLDELGYKRFDW